MLLSSIDCYIQCLLIQCVVPLVRTTSSSSRNVIRFVLTQQNNTNITLLYRKYLELHTVTYQFKLYLVNSSVCFPVRIMKCSFPSYKSLYMYGRFFKRWYFLIPDVFFIKFSYIKYHITAWFSDVFPSVVRQETISQVLPPISSR